MYQNINARNRMTTTLTPPEPEVTLDQVLEMSAALDAQFGEHAGFSLAKRFNADSVKTLWHGAYREYMKWGEAALGLNIHPGAKEWTVKMLCDYAEKGVEL